MTTATKSTYYCLVPIHADAVFNIEAEAGLTDEQIRQHIISLFNGDIPDDVTVETSHDVWDSQDFAYEIRRSLDIRGDEAVFEEEED